MALPSLRTWQQEALTRWINAGYRGIFAVATGGGKTLFALSAREVFLKTYPDSPTVIIVPTTALLDQWFVELCDVAEVPENEIKILNGKDLVPNRKVNLVVINSARGFDELSYSGSPVLLIVDECHRAGSAENAKSLRIRSSGTIGLSATPEREFDTGLEDALVPVLGEILYRYSLIDAIRDGVLASLSLQYVRVPFLESELEKYNQLSRKIAVASSRDDAEVLEVLLRTRARVYNQAFYRIPVTRSVMSTRRGVRTIIFLESISLAEDLRNQLDFDGHSVTIYHSQLSKNLRRSNLRLFRRGVFDVLITCRALDEGFNVPEARLAVIVAGTSSKRQRTQRVGRVLRAMDEKTLGEVITLYASPVEEKRLVEEARSLGLEANTSWRSASVNV